MTLRRIQIDLNRRARGGYLLAPYAGPTPVIGEDVIVFEPEDGVCAAGRVAEVNDNRSVAYIDVDWDSMTEDVPNEG